MFDEKMLTMPLQPNKLFVTECGDHMLYEYYLVGEIGHPDEYLELCHALRSARPEDKFILRLNSGGGQVRTGNQIINALEESEAMTIGFIEHDCGSMCTFIFLACSTWGVSKYAEWFSHTVSGGNYGKESETFEASQFLRRQTHKRIRDDYKYFLTDEEIESVLKGSDIYLDADEIMDRLERFDEARNGDEEDMELPPSLDEIIKQAVAEGIKQHEAEKAKKEAKAKKAADRKPSPKLEKALEQAKEIRENFEKPVDVPAGTD